MYRSDYEFIQSWRFALHAPKWDSFLTQRLLILGFVHQSGIEAETYKNLLKQTVPEIERLLNVYVKKVLVRPLLNCAFLCFDMEPKPDQGLRIWTILISDDPTSLAKGLPGGPSPKLTFELECFVHELLHLALIEHKLHIANEEKLDAVAKYIVKNYWRHIEKIFLKVRTEAPEDTSAA